MHFVYILYSLKLNTYYVGESPDISERLNEHNNGFYVQSYTKQSKDWQIFFVLECDDKSHARKIENHIKRMKSRKYIESLKEYPELVEKLKFKYKQRSQSR